MLDGKQMGRSEFRLSCRPVSAESTRRTQLHAHLGKNMMGEQGPGRGGRYWQYSEVAAMATPAARADAVKAALSGKSASASTVTTLQSLLDTGSASTTSADHAESKRYVPTKTATVRNPKATNRKAATKPGIAVHEDAPETLTPKAKSGLATEVVNITLKALTDASKVKSKVSTSSVPSAPATPRTTRRTSSISSKPLQPRQENATPAKSSPKKAKASRRPAAPPCTGSVTEDSVYVVATAECARLAFSYLRSVKTQVIGVKDLPRFQLEAGMLALAARLVALGLDVLAVKELRVVKRRLQPGAKSSAVAKNSRLTAPHKCIAESEKETLASLLQLDPGVAESPEVLALAVTHQQLVLRLIATSRKPNVIEAALEYLSLDTANCPADLIKRQATLSGNTSKAAKQLEGLSKSLLGLCPSASAGADQIALDGSVYPCPTIVFELQILALRIRQQWWNLAGHKADHEKELAEPFSKCLASFVRRSSVQPLDAGRYDLGQRSHDQLGLRSLSYSSDTQCSILRTLAALAEQCALNVEAYSLAKKLVQACEELDPHHARAVASLVKQSAVMISAGSKIEDVAKVDENLSAIAHRLKNQLSGHTADYDLLLGELSQLVRLLAQSADCPEIQSPAIDVLCVAANFAQRYARSYPGKNLRQAQTIICGVLRCSKASDDLNRWATPDAADILIQAGSLQAVAEAASTRPLCAAWSLSGATVALDRILHAVLSQAVKSGCNTTMNPIHDDELLNSAERAAILERQLMYAADMANRPKYHHLLQKPMQDILRRLSNLYVAEEFPIRRARIACMAFRLRESHPEMLPLHAMKVWQDSAIDPDHLARDDGLRLYLNDIKAGLDVANAFHEGRPSVASLKPSLLVWQRTIDGATSAEGLRCRIDDPGLLSLQLKAVASFFNILGDSVSRLPVLRMLLRLSQILEDSIDDQITAGINLAQQYLDLGFSEETGHVLARAHRLLDSGRISDMVKLHLHLMYAEYLLAIDNFEMGRETLELASVLRTKVPPEQISRGERRAYELTHARAWLTQSKLCLKSGAPHDALAAAKSCVRLLNSAWAATERSNASRASEPVAEPSHAIKTTVDGLTAGVSKLNLLPKGIEQSKEDRRATEKGAAYWLILPTMCRAMLHLSDMYAAHGLFAEADYYSERAASIAESVGSSMLLSRIRCHRSQLMASAGRVEEAELCLSKIEDVVDDREILSMAEHCCTTASVRAKEGSLSEALQLYQKAIQAIEGIQAVGYVQDIERFKSDHETSTVQMAGILSAANDERSGEDIAVEKPSARTTKQRRAPASKSLSKTAVSRTAGRKPPSKPTEEAPSQQATGPYLLDKLKASILLKKLNVPLRYGTDVAADLDVLEQARSSIPGTSQQRRIQFQMLMHKAAAAIQFDISYNMLPESTLSFPALVRTDRRASELGAPRSSLLSLPVEAPVTVVAPAKAGTQRKTAVEGLGGLLQAARECLVDRRPASVCASGTADIYTECSMLSSVSMLLSAAGLAGAKSALHPIREALHIEQPRISALQCEARALLLDSERSSLPFTWPDTYAVASLASMTAAAFQEQYIDILPKPWTVVSVTLNEECSELYVTRYRAGQSPLILRLPFSRQKHDDDDDEAFDYHKAKAELQDIIQTSDYSCHNAGSLEAKGAKNNWWSEREALDRRLHELLMNVENIWFGGFKGVFSQHAEHPNLLARFRSSFENILTRYLPSRQAVKGRSKPLALDNKVLELFIGLGTDQDGVVDLDEPLADLLYFVVDMLQFGGERNAYDEIDFDSMAVDVLDALRSYYEACPDGGDGQHMILVLDKRLQAFPWESLPCLEDASVSRVGSILSLRHRILAMNQSAGSSATRKLHNDGDFRYVINRSSGTYVLNPSKDLTNTQTLLSAPLSRLAGAESAKWTSMIQQEPSEDDMRTALRESSMLLYFGHGSGAQYIRPRTIRKLDKCSDVVWLMGCSSGAVTEHGELEPSAVPLAYLMAGSKDWPLDDARSGTEASTAGRETDGGICMAVVATLWDVTDKDIDRFSLAMGEEWGLWAPSEASKLPAKTPKKRDRLVAPATPQQVPKTPKTPKARKTPAPAKTPARSRSRPRQEEGKKQSLVEAVARSRDACYLRYLNGAASVVYGIPVYLSD